MHAEVPGTRNGRTTGCTVEDQKKYPRPEKDPHTRFKDLSGSVGVATTSKLVGVRGRRQAQGFNLVVAAQDERGLSRLLRVSLERRGHQ